MRFSPKDVNLRFGLSKLDRLAGVAEPSLIAELCWKNDLNAGEYLQFEDEAGRLNWGDCCLAFPDQDFETISAQKLPSSN